jgi:hypothetical protein
MNSRDETAPAELPESESHSVRPQLRLHHFFALTAVAAVLLALHGQQPDFWSNSEFAPPRVILTLMTGATVIYVLIVAVAVTAVAYGIYWQRTGQAFFDQPGHWLLVEIAVVGLFGMVPTIFTRWIFNEASSGNFDDDFPMAAMIAFGLYSLVFMFAVPCVLNIYFGLKKCRETRWSLVFYLKAASKLLFGFGELFVLALIGNAVWRDRREHIARDSSHYCGVLVQCALSFVLVALLIISMVNMGIMFSNLP